MIIMNRIFVLSVVVPDVERRLLVAGYYPAFTHTTIEERGNRQRPSKDRTAGDTSGTLRETITATGMDPLSR
jgi:hypothetical protein